MRSNPPRCVFRRLHTKCSFPCRGCVNGQYLVGNSEQSVECGLNCFPTIYCDVAVQDFLEDFGVRNQTLSVADQFFK
jgi:hypothetical protein